MPMLQCEAVPLSLYIHVPFCSVRCAYCDFNTYAGMEGLMPAYAEAVGRELALVAPFFSGEGGPASEPTEVHTVFFGGGTPSLLPPDFIEAILGIVRGKFRMTDRCEVTLEANPGTLGRQDLDRLRRAGVNRLSLGAQSAQPSELRLLDRAHTFDDVASAVEQARRAGFDNLNLDLIYGLPWQALGTWRDTIGRTLDLAPDHLSLYALSLEHGTPLRAWVERGLVASPDPDVAAEMYEWAEWRLAEDGYVQYEISNWARDGGGGSERELPTFACRHNLQYWRNQPYLGIGAGAHGCALGWRYANVLSPRLYIDRLQAGVGGQAPCSPAATDRTALDLSTQMDETLLLGFRLTREGVRPSAFLGRFGQDVEARYGDRLKRLEGDGLIERGPDRLRLTAQGRLLGNRVFQEFV
jgi:oxygen-independent coproporphyrinogen-3 oxidase